MIKAIIFDLGNVLIDDPEPRMYGYYAEKLGIERSLLEKTAKKNAINLQKGIISEAELWERVADELNINLPEDYVDIWLEGFVKTFSERKDVFKLVTKVKKMGYKTAMLSNTEKPIASFIRAQDYKDFDVFVFSCEVGMVKPESNIYKYTLKQLDVKAQETIFIDDREENIEGAEKLGIKGILFKGVDSLKRKLDSFGINF